MSLSVEHDNNVLAAPPAVDSDWEQCFPERYAGTRVRVTAVKFEDGQVWVESEEPAFPGARVWLDLPRWLDIYVPAGQVPNLMPRQNNGENSA